MAIFNKELSFFDEGIAIDKNDYDYYVTADYDGKDKRILSELNKPESLIVFVADRHGHDQRYAIDPAKANKELGWDPITTFEVGIKKLSNGIYLKNVLFG